MYANGRAGTPRPVIVYRLSRPTPLIASRRLRDAEGEVKVTFRDQQVNEPHTAALTVVCKGRKDIADSDFNKQRPLVFDLGAPIVTLLAADPERTKISPASLAADGSKLRLGSGPIRPGPVLSIEILTEGRPNLTCEGDDNPLINVVVRDGAADDRRIFRRNRALATATAAAFAVIAIAIGWQVGPEVRTADVALFSTFGVFLGWTAAIRRVRLLSIASARPPLADSLEHVGSQLSAILASE